MFNTSSVTNKDKVKKVMDYITSHSSDYSLEKFCNDNKLLKDAEERGNNVAIPCLYHTDYDPSMSLDFNKNIFKCFACGKTGGYINFVYFYYKLHLGKPIPYYILLNDFLKKDSEMRLELGFVDVNESSGSSSLEDLSNFELDTSIKTKFTCDNYTTIANKIIKNKLPEETKFYFLAMMQEGVTPQNINKELFGSTNDYKIEDTDLNENSFLDIIGGEFR